MRSEAVAAQIKQWEAKHASQVVEHPVSAESYEGPWSPRRTKNSAQKTQTAIVSAMTVTDYSIAREWISAAAAFCSRQYVICRIPMRFLTRVRKLPLSRGSHSQVPHSL